MFGFRGQKDREIERLTRLLQESREKASERKARESGEQRGILLVAEQLASDIRLGTLREEQHRQNAARYLGDMQKVLRAVAGHVLDARATAGNRETVEMCELLVEELLLTGVPLRAAFLAVQAERSDNTVRVTTEDAKAAVVVAPVPAGR